MGEWEGRGSGGALFWGLLFWGLWEGALFWGFRGAPSSGALCFASPALFRGPVLGPPGPCFGFCFEVFGARFEVSWSPVLGPLLFGVSEGLGAWALSGLFGASRAWIWEVSEGLLE